jgi:hypothetical protein
VYLLEFDIGCLGKNLESTRAPRIKKNLGSSVLKGSCFASVESDRFATEFVSTLLSHTTLLQLSPLCCWCVRVPTDYQAADNWMSHFFLHFLIARLPGRSKWRLSSRQHHHTHRRIGFPWWCSVSALISFSSTNVNLSCLYCHNVSRPAN